MPLSKERDKERSRDRMRKVRLEQRRIRLEQPDFKIPNRYLSGHIAAYPEGFNPDGSYRRDYDPRLDPYINPLLRPGVIPDCSDGRYHEALC